MTPPQTRHFFDGIDDISERLQTAGYLADRATATCVHLADRLAKPLLIEGPAGVGKSRLAREFARRLAHPLQHGIEIERGVDGLHELGEDVAVDQGGVLPVDAVLRPGERAAARRERAGAGEAVVDG